LSYKIDYTFILIYTQLPVYFSAMYNCQIAKYIYVTYRQSFKFEKLGFCFKNSIHFGECIQVLY